MNDTPLDVIEIGGGEGASAALDGLILDLNITNLETGGSDTDPDPDPDDETGDETDPEEPVDPEPEDPVVDPDPDPDLDPGEPTGPAQIDGAFRVDATVRFDDVIGGYWQRVFDFGDGPSTNNIVLSQIENTTDLMFEMWQDGSVYRVTAENAIVQGETATFSVGAEPDGRIWLSKDGNLLAEGEGIVPADVERVNLLVGESNWPEDEPLIGEVSVIDVLQGDTYVGADDVGAPDPVEPEDPDDPIDPEEPDDPETPGGDSAIDPDGSGSPSTGRGDMAIVAHQDDDLLFMNPTISEAIDGDLPVTTVYLTAGDFGLGEEYWGAREAGVKAAYAHMAGSDDWVDETVPLGVGDTQFDVASSYLESHPDVRLYFLRLPDGFSGTGSERYDFESLAKLWDGTDETATTVDDTNTFTGEQLSSTLTALMERHEPDQLHILDSVGENAALEHSDHFHSSEFANQAAQDYTQGATVLSYEGYATWGFEENVEGEALAETQEIFDIYAQFDPQVFGADGELLGAYQEWVQREFVADEYVIPPIDAEAADLAAADLAAQEEEAAALEDELALL